MSVSPSDDARFDRLRLRADDAEAAERALAEAFACGASGAEELEAEGEGGVTFDVYAPEAVAAAVRAVIEAAGARVLSVSPVVSRDWSEAWKRDLGPIVVSPRLVVRPSFASHATEPEQRVLVIDPGQAFGTGAHESTRLALEAIDALAEERLGASLLDVGTGSGVLALAGLALGCAEAVGFDLDPLAGQAARENARHNRLDAHLGLFVGGLAALAPGRRFDWIAANLLLSELRPLLAPMAAHLAGDGVLVLSGLLAEQAPEVRERAAALGFREEQTLRRADASGAMWVALVMCREGAGPRR